MRLPQIQRPIQAAVMAGGYRPVLASFALPIRPTAPTAQTLRVGDATGVEGRRYASVKSQGAYKIPNKKTIAKKLGAKRSGDQFVIPGNIIFKQRGTIWHAGFNAIRGRDHTIHAAATGYVKYYRDPFLHPDKQYIGVAFNKEDKLPYPRTEPRRRKLGMVAHVRKPGAGPRPAVSDTGIPNSVLRKAGLFNIESLERRLWNADKRREMKDAEVYNARAAKAAMAGLVQVAVAPEVVAVAGSTTASASAQPGVIHSGGATNVDDFAAAATSVATSSNTIATTATAGAPFPRFDPKFILPSKEKIPNNPGRLESVKTVTTGEYLQKTWQERRRTKVLLLNPRNYSYAESNSAIGRLSAKTMYTPPWKLGGRKSRFRSRRRRNEGKIAQLRADKLLVRTEKEKERIAQEKKRADKLAKQRARGRKSEEKAAAAGAETAAVIAEKPQAVESVTPVEGAAPVEGVAPVEAEASAQPVEIKKTEVSVEAQQITEEKGSSQPAEVKQVESIAAQEDEKPVDAEKTEKPTEIKDSNKPAKP